MQIDNILEKSVFTVKIRNPKYSSLSVACYIGNNVLLSLIFALSGRLYTFQL